MALNDWLQVLAILLSPLIALQVSRRLEEQKDARRRRMWIFNTLMATRNARVSPEHVRALNSIDIEFVSQQPVTRAWTAYRDHLNDTSQDPSVWGPKMDDLFVELLFAMATTLKFDFDKTYLKRSIYTPRAHGESDEDAMVIRKAAVAIAKGEQGLRIDLSEITRTPEEALAAGATKKAVAEVLAGQRPLRVVVESDKPHTS